MGKATPPTLNQATAMAVRELEWCKMFLSIQAVCALSIDSEEVLCKMGSSFANAKALRRQLLAFDPMKKRTAVHFHPARGEGFSTLTSFNFFSAFLCFKSD